jgi:queuine tRNA-ribosyltransferase
MSAFTLKTKSDQARSGVLLTPHGEINTPVFMPVGTYGVVKSLSTPELKSVGTQILLGNTYHLYLRPGVDLMKQVGGLHPFMNWERPILTDSGGFQIFSLGKLKKLTDDGVVFQSHLNGDRIELTPERAALIQQTIGSDIAMVLDQCPALPNSEDAIRQAVIRSAAWAKRFFAVERKPGQLIFGICQGGTSASLRKLSLDLTLELPVDGIALGGLSVGESHEEMVQTLESVAAYLPPELPHYLMGVGTPLDLLEGVRLGIDMFDCVLPTRNGRNGGFFTHDGLLNIRNQSHTKDLRPIDSECECDCCAHYSRAYLRHLFQIKEILGCRLATLHNLHYYHRFMSEMRRAIEVGTFSSYYSQMQPRLKQGYGSKPKLISDQEESSV